MAAEVAAVTAKLGADTSAFDAGFDRAGEKTAGLEQQIVELEATVREMGEGTAEAMQEMASAMDEAGEHAEGMHEELGADVSRRAIRETVAMLKELGEAIVDATKKMDPAAGEAWDESIAQMKDATEEALGTLGEKLLPVMEEVVGWITNAVDAWNGLDQSTKDNVATVVEIVAGLAAASAALAYLVETAELLAPIFTSALPEVLVVGAAIAGLVVVADELKKAFESSGTTGSSAWQTFKDAISQVGDAIAKVGNLIGEAMFTPLTMTLKAVADVADALKTIGVGDGGGSIRQMAEGLDEAAKHMGDDFVSSVKELPQTIADAASAIASKVATDAKDLFGNLLGPSQHEHVQTDSEREAAAEDLKVRQQIAELAKQVMKEQAQEDAKAAAEAQKEADARIAAAKQAAEIQRQADADSMKNAEATAKAAQQHLDDLKKNGGTYDDVQAAVTAVDAAYSKVQAAGAQAISDLQAQLDVNNKQLALLDLVGDQLEAQKQIEQIKKENAALERSITDDQTKLEDLKRQNIDRARQELQAYQQGAGLGSIGSKFAGATDFGKLATDTVSATSAGGPAAGVAAAGYDLLSASPQFKQMVSEINSLFGDIATAVGSVLGPVIPLIHEVEQAVQPILDVLGKILGALGQVLIGTIMPILEPLLGLSKPLTDFLTAIGPLIGPIEQISQLLGELANLFDPFTLALYALGPMLELAADAINWVVSGISSTWNGLVESVADFFRSLDKLPVVGGAMDDVANALDNLQIQSFQASDAVGQFGDDVSRAAAQTSNAFQNALDKYNSDVEKVTELQNAIAYAQKNGASPSEIKSLQQQLAQAQQQEDIDEHLANAQGFKDAGMMDQYYAEMDRALLDETQATQANTAATQQLTDSLTNVPQMFKVNQVIDQITSGSSGGGTSGSSGGHTGRAGALDQRVQNVLANGTYNEVQINGDVHFHDDSGLGGKGGASVWEYVKGRLKADQQSRKGTSTREPASRWLIRDLG